MEIIKIAAIPVILALMIITSAIFMSTGLEGVLVTTWVSGTMTAVFGYIGGKAIPTIHKGWKKLRGK